MKKRIVPRIAHLVCRGGLGYQGWMCVAKWVRQEGDLRPVKRGRKLTRVLTAEEFRKSYKVVGQAEDLQHSIMLRLLFNAALPVAS